MGGKVAMAFVLQYPAQLKSLIVMDVAPVAYDHSYAVLIDALLALPVATLASRDEANERLANTIPEAALRTFLLQNLHRQESGYAWRFNLPTIKASLVEIVAFPTFPPGAQYCGPSLFLAGENSDYIQAAYHPQIKSLFPAGRIHTIADARHWLHAEKPQSVLDELTTFLAA